MYYFIVNKSSRTGKAAEIWSLLEKELEKRNVCYELHFTEYGGHATELATKICEDTKGIKNVMLFVVGGDGTANEVINGITDFDRIYFGYIPTGSGNDLGRGLKISSVNPLQRLATLLDRYGDGSTEIEGEVKDVLNMDLGEVTAADGESRKFAISSGIGIDADVCKQALTSKLKNFLNAIHLGSATYGILTVKTLFSMPLADGVAHVDGVEDFPLKNMIFTAAMNHACEGGGVPMAPSATCTDGKLSLCMVQGIKRFACFLAFPRLLAGKHQNIKGFRLVDCSELVLELDKPMVIHADGEYVGTESTVSFKCLPGLLKVLV